MFLTRFKACVIATLLFFVALQADAGTYFDLSGTVTTGGTSQEVRAAAAAPRRILIANPTTATENLFVNTSSAASTSAAGSIPIAPGGALTLNTAEAINITAATTGHAFIVKDAGTAEMLVNPGTSSGGGGGLTDTQLRATPVPVSGTVTANIGTAGTLATAAKQDTAQTSRANIESYTSRLLSGATAVGPAAATATTGQAVSGQYDSTPPTYTNGQQGIARLNVNGALQVALPDGVPFNSTAASAVVLSSGFPVNVGPYNSVVVEVTTNSATVNFEFSTDGTVAYRAASCILDTNSGSSSLVSSTATTGRYICRKDGQFFQARQSGAGSTATTTYLSQRLVLGVTQVRVENTVPASQSGTWTVQPGNTANTTAWKVDGSAVTQPVSEAGGATVAPKVGDATGAITDTFDGIGILRRDALTSLSSATAKWLPLQGSKWGAVFVEGYEKHSRTYSSTVNVAAAASATDIAYMAGSATSPALVTRVIISGVQTTAGSVDVTLLTRSTANSAGTCTAATMVAHDPGDSAPNAVVTSCTANPTTGTLVGTVRRAYQLVPTAAGTSSVAPLVFDFGKEGKPITLTTSNKVLAVNLGGVTVTGGTFSITFEWIENP